MSLASICDSIAQTLDTEVASLKAAKLIGGKVDLAELKRRSVALPAALVTCLGTRGSRLKGKAKIVTRAMFAIFVACSSGVGAEAARERLTMALAGEVLVLVTASTWGDPEINGTADGESIDSDNLYDDKLDAMGVALWVVTWEQDVTLDALTEPATLDDFLLAHGEVTHTDSTEDTDAVDDVHLQGG